MARKAGSADLPLHGGHVPKWLADRMTRLGAVISEAIVHHYGPVADHAAAGTACARMRSREVEVRRATEGEACLDGGQSARVSVSVPSRARSDRPLLAPGVICRCPGRSKVRCCPRNPADLANVGYAASLPHALRSLVKLQRGDDP